MAIKGACIFNGYYKRPDLTAKAFDASGNLATSAAVNTSVATLAQSSAVKFIASELVISSDAVAGLGDGYSVIEIGSATQIGTPPVANVNFAAI